MLMQLGFQLGLAADSDHHRIGSIRLKLSYKGPTDCRAEKQPVATPRPIALPLNRVDIVLC